MALENLTTLDARFMEAILRSKENDESIEVCGITIEPGTPECTNYTSDIHRVAVEYTQRQGEVRKQESFIVKVILQNDTQERTNQLMGMFDTELTMLSVTLPKMNESLGELSSTPLNPLCFYVQLHENPMWAVMEDLKPRGFQLADFPGGLDLDHCLLTFRNLGRFHGASIKLKEKDPKAFTKYTMGLLHEDHPPSRHQLFNTYAKRTAEALATWPDLAPRIKEKLLALSKIVFKKGCQALAYEEDDFNVLNHGDLWSSNTLFLYDEQQKPVEQIFVDFQRCHYGSPADDILNFFGTSLNNDIRFLQRQLLLREYHASLSDTMTKLKCNTDILSFEKLQESLKKRGFCEVVPAVTTLPYILRDKDEEIVKMSDENSGEVYHRKLYKEAMMSLLPWWDSMGILDV